MTTQTTNTNKNDNYYTQFYTYNNLKPYIYKKGEIKKVIDPFQLGAKLSKITYYKRVIFDGWICDKGEEDFFENLHLLECYDLIITNPPFSIKKEIMEKLIELEKPFIMVLNSTVLSSKWFHSLTKEKKEDFQITFPSGKISYELYNDEGQRIRDFDPKFYTVYISYKVEELKGVQFIDNPTTNDEKKAIITEYYNNTVKEFSALGEIKKSTTYQLLNDTMKEFIGSQEAKLYSKLHLLGEEKRFIETPIKDRIKRKPITLTIEPPPPQEGEFDDAEEDEINITIETNNTFSGLLGDMIDELNEETLNHRKSTL